MAQQRLHQHEPQRRKSGNLAAAPIRLHRRLRLNRQASVSLEGRGVVVRKSGAFADSIAMVVEHADGGIAVALGGAVARPFLLATFGERLQAGEASEDGLRAAIAQDLKIGAPQGDSYLMRLHTATALRGR